MTESANGRHRLSPAEYLEQQMRSTHQTFLEASLDEGSPIKGGSLTPAQQAWRELQGYREMYKDIPGTDDKVYRSILEEALPSRPEHWD